MIISFVCSSLTVTPQKANDCISWAPCFILREKVYTGKF